jgi:hypothetical protein
MAYTINKTDGTTLLTLNDNTVQTVGGISVFGRGQSQYGEALNENLVKLLEHFSSTQPPADALVGQLWYDSGQQAIKVKVNPADAATSWKNVATSPVASSAPLNPIAGDLWYDSSSGQQKLKVYVGSAWLTIGPYVQEASNTEIAPSANNGNAILLVKIANVIIGIFSGVEFVPNPAITGFSKIYAGFTLRTGHSFGTAALKVDDTGIVPLEDNTKVLGSSGYRFSEVWATNLYGNITSATTAAGSAQTDAVKITATNTAGTQYPAFVGGLSGYSGINVDSNLTYNPNTNLLETTGTVKARTLESTVVTGTAPLVVASTTKVANLTADRASGWETKRKVTFGGVGSDVTGEFEIDGTANVGNVELTVSQTKFATPNAVSAAISAVLPPGSIILWYGTAATIPTGWALCDGQNGTPNLVNKFVIAAFGDVNDIAVTNVEGSNKKEGGTANAVVVSHTHTAISNVTDPGHVHGFTYNSQGDGFGGTYVMTVTAGGNTRNTQSASTGISVTTTNSSAGETGDYKNIPPYYALCYIMRVFPT